MSVVSIVFSKISAERAKPLQGKISLKNNVEFKSVKKIGFVAGSAKQDCLRVGFEYTSVTEPEAGKIALAGDLVFLAKPEQIEEAVKEWEANKNLPKPLVVPVMNAILKEASIEAIGLSKTMGLPCPVKLPTVTLKEVNK